MSVPKLELHPIEATSPSLAEVMRSCFLRAGLSKISSSSSFVLGNPKSWLGIAYHEVLKEIPNVDLTKETIDTAVVHLWNQAIAEQHKRAMGHPLDRRFSPPETWPGYQIARASVLLRAKDLAGRTGFMAKPGFSPSGKFEEIIREQEFMAYGGKLVGRPDFIRAGEVVDYKSGAIIEYDEDTHAEVVKAAYIRQLRIYGYLVKETLGWWPQRGLILPLLGTGVEITLEPADCQGEAMEAVTLLGCYNAKVRLGMEPEVFASPSPQGCSWCPYKILCPLFWKRASPGWQLDGAAIEGVLTETPQAIHGGAAEAISIDIQAGNESCSRVQIAPLNLAVHMNAAKVFAGDRVRLIGLRVRSDGKMIPTQRTLLARVADLPSLGVARGELEPKRA